jgi:hypothetical protein
VSKTFTVRANCEYSTQVTVRDNQGAEDAIKIADHQDVASWDSQAWSEITAEEE